MSCQLLIDCSLPFKRWGAKVDFSENWSIQSSPVVDIVTEVPPGLARFLFSLDGREGWSELPAHPVEDPIVLHTANDLISPGLVTTLALHHILQLQVLQPDRVLEPGGHHGSQALNVGAAAGIIRGGGVWSPVALVEDHDDEDGAAHHTDSTAYSIRLSNNELIK